jgi:UDP-N-acetyl-2-amino-2-deoxyglucuronate dehydrogenase
MMMKTWGIGLIGCGSIADFHIKAIQEMDNARLVIVASRNPDRARAVGERVGCTWTTDYHDVISNPDVEIVCLTTDSGSHGKIGLETLRAGKHLLVEKPMAMTVAEANQMIAEAKERGLTLSVVSQRRFERQHQFVKQVLMEGRLGKLLFVEVACPYFRPQSYYDSADWRGTIARDGGALMNQGIHSIDLMLWMAGPVQSVFGKVATQTHQIEAEDIGIALLTFQNGAYGTLMSSTNIQPGLFPSLNLYGERGTIKLEGSRIVHWTVPDVPEPEFDSSQSNAGGVVDPRSIPAEYHKAQIADVLDAVSNHRQPFVSGEDGREAVRLVEAIYRSARTGTEIQLGD